MYIAYIIPSLRNVGPVLVVKELVKQMTKEGHYCHVFFFDNQKEVDMACPISQISFFKIMDFDKFDIVHTHGIRPDAYVFLHKKAHCRTRFISTLHNYIFRDLSYQYNKLIALIFGYLWIFFLSRHNSIVALSKDAVSYYRKWIKESRLTWAYNTRSIPLNEKLEAQELNQLVSFKQNHILIGVNALLTKRKGIDMLICSLKGLPQYKLFIIGDGKVKPHLVQLAKNCSVYDRVYFAGYHKDAYRYLPYYDVFAIPSRSEGFPLALLEASIIGVPTVCSDISVFKELYTDQEVSFFKLEDINSLIEAIKRVVVNRTYSENIHKKYINNYSPAKFAQKYIAIYESVL